MAEERKDAGKPPEPAAPKVKKGLPKMLIVVIAVTVVEGGLFFGAMKMFGGGPQVAHGAAAGKDVLHGEDPHKTETVEAVEIELLTKFKVPNDKSGALFIYDLDLYVKVAKAKQAAIEALVSARKGELSDRVARIIRGNDAAVLNEADLKTLRTQVRNTLGDLAGDPEIIQEVLIPRCVPMRTE
jgi:flagellar basal body-associated protein FliL